MLGNILNAGETREAEAELRELPGDVKKKQVGSSSAGRSGWAGRGRGKGRDRVKEEEEAAAVIGSSQPWVGILKARWVNFLSLFNGLTIVGCKLSLTMGSSDS
jgi:hypothetical protein